MGKYYDGFGKDVSDYVTSLEVENQRLKIRVQRLEGEIQLNFKKEETVEPVVVEEEKPKRKKRSKRKKNADSQ